MLIYLRTNQEDKRESNVPPQAAGRVKYFLQTWGVALISLLCFTLLLAAVGAPEHYVSGFGGIVLPAACATYFARYRLARASIG